jgi:hypothetical protein
MIYLLFYLFLAEASEPRTFQWNTDPGLAGETGVSGEGGTV